MSRKPLIITRHASERLLNLNLTIQDLEKIQTLGKVRREGKTKLKIVGRIKKGAVVLICEEYSDHIVVKTIARRR